MAKDIRQITLDYPEITDQIWSVCGKYVTVKGSSGFYMDVYCKNEDDAALLYNAVVNRGADEVVLRLKVNR